MVLVAGMPHLAGHLFAAEGGWPEMGPLPKELNLEQDGKPLLRYGRPIRYFTPEQRKALWNARVRKDHPRIYFTADTLPALRDRMKTHPAFPELKAKAEAGDSLAAAFVFQITGEKKYAKTALDAIRSLEKGTRKLSKADVIAVALIFDWCYTAIEAGEMEALVKTVAKFGVNEAEDPNAAEAKPKQYRTFSTGLTEASQAPTFSMTHLYIALAHHWPGAEEEAMSLFHPDGSYLGGLMANDHFWIEGGMHFNQGLINWNNTAIRSRLAFDSATGLNTLLDEEAWGSNVNNRLFWLLYRMELEGAHDLDFRYVVIGRPVIPLRDARFHRYGLHILNFAAKNPYYQWFINRVIYPEGPVNALKGDSQRLIELALWWDPSVPEKRPDDLPLGRFTPPGTYQHATFRSGFKGKGDTIVTMEFSDGWDGDSGGGGHFSSFRIYRDEFLSCMSGAGAVFERCAYGENNIAFFDTSTRTVQGKEGLDKYQFASLNPDMPYAAGFDFPVPSQFRSNGDDFPYLGNAHKKMYGTVSAFQTRAQFDYIAYATTPLFYPATVVKEWTGQAVFLRPGVFVRFDRVEVADPKIQPRFFVWVKGERPEVKGKIVASTVYGFVDDYDGDEASWSGHLHRSRLHFKALMPVKKHIRSVGGSLADAPTTDLVAGTKRTMAGPAKNGGFSRGHGIGGRLILDLKRQTAAGEQIIPGLCIDTAPQLTAGPFTAKVLTENPATAKIQLIQTAGQKDKSFPLAWYPTLSSLVGILNTEQWRAQVIANYENWVEGNVWRRPELEGAAIDVPAVYDSQGRMPEAKRKAILAGDPGNRPDILNAACSGHLEVRLPDTQAEARQYFLNVFTATDAEGKELTPPASALEEDERSATAVLKWPGETVRITFVKTGAQAGHIRIENGGKAVVDEDFIDRVDLSNQPMGSDFMGKKKRN